MEAVMEETSRILTIIDGGVVISRRKEKERRRREKRKEEEQFQNVSCRVNSRQTRGTQIRTKVSLERTCCLKSTATDGSSIRLKIKKLCTFLSGQVIAKSVKSRKL
ncbi:hypothetical protein AXX17_AT2G10470 [Arabidopsis thaliana]|uniref:Uncharacterized protein n=1 Tax=Arabidopsis thaliana TaxID=3702 RepID=A0A178W2D9_ARATH|nr:hypothetical protein AXX17_AT2G10470 [Arabidopsis thaliana]